MKNILLISFDDAVAFWKYRNIFQVELQTPNIDRICEQSTVFQSAYCQSPLCGPSRASFMSGMSPHQTGVFGNKPPVFTKMDPTDMWSYRLKEAGYFCSSGGKVHHGYRPLPQEPHDVLYSDGRKHFKIDTGLRADIEQTQLGGIGQGLCTTNPKDSGHYYDAHATKSFAQFLDTYNDDAPFYREVGFYSPHLPCITPIEYKEMYHHGDFKFPPEWSEDGDDLFMMNPYISANFKTQNWRNWRKSVRNYFAAITHGDHYLGQVWNLLKASKHADNTIVVILADHGMHLGEKKRFGKSTLLEQVAGVPLIVHDPDHDTGRVVTDPVALLDVGPTVMDYTGVDGQRDFLGQSLRPIVEGAAADPARVVPTFKETSASIRKGQYRFIRQEDGHCELYDLDHDWWQKHPLGADHPVYADMAAAHRTCCQAHGFFYD